MDSGEVSSYLRLNAAEAQTTSKTTECCTVKCCVAILYLHAVCCSWWMFTCSNGSQCHITKKFRDNPNLMSYEPPTNFPFNFAELESFMNVIYGAYDETLYAICYSENPTPLLCKVNSVGYASEDGLAYRVIAYNEDGSFVTQSIDDIL
jgi:hypothetical protein